MPLRELLAVFGELAGECQRRYLWKDGLSALEGGSDEQRIDYVCSEYHAYYLLERPHQGEGIDNELLHRRKTKRGNVEDEIVLLADVRCKQRLGVLLRSYERKAA